MNMDLKRRKNMRKRKQTTLKKFLYRVIVKSLALSTIAILLVTLVLMQQGKKETEMQETNVNLDLDKTYMETASAKEMLFEYIDTLPIPEEDEVSTFEEIEGSRSVLIGTKEIISNIQQEEIMLTLEETKEQVRNEIQNQATTMQELKAVNLVHEVGDITPTLRAFNVSAYCPCVECCDKTDGITASNEKAIQWYTIAAGRRYKVGTIIYIPSLADCPNGGWFIVQDRGGAISNEKLDIYFNTHMEAKEFGRHVLECYVYEF